VFGVDICCDLTFDGVAFLLAREPAISLILLFEIPDSLFKAVDTIFKFGISRSKVSNTVASVRVLVAAP